MKARFSKTLRLLSTFGVALWVVAPRAPAQTNLSLGLQLARHGVLLTITGAVGTACQIIYANGLANTNDWLYLAYLVLPTNPCFCGDPIPPSPAATRFYRALFVPTNMILIPAGTFTMGNSTNSSEGGSEELPQHTVNVSGFYTDRYEVTKALWDAVYYWAVTNGYSFGHAGVGRAPGHPVQSIDWHDAVKWCNARSENEGRVPAYYTDAAPTAVYRSGTNDLASDWVKWDAGYRLPTEAEWERAARGGANRHRFPWSGVETINQSQANYYSLWSGGVPAFPYDVNPTSGYHPAFTNGVSGYTSPAGYFAANGYGLYDIAGNVDEWCWDWYDAAYYSSSPGTDPRGPATGSRRVKRGGSFGTVAKGCRVANRSYTYPTYSFTSLGFRCVLPPAHP